MQTFDVQQAVDFLKCSLDQIRLLAASGKIPGAKVGRAWVLKSGRPTKDLSFPLCKSTTYCTATGQENLKNQKNTAQHGTITAQPGTIPSHRLPVSQNRMIFNRIFRVLRA